MYERYKKNILTNNFIFLIDNFKTAVKCAIIIIIFLIRQLNYL